MTQTERGIDELKRAGLFDEDSDYGDMVGKAVERLLLTHQKEGHSGFSSSLVADIFHRLVEGKVLSPLTGKPDEWNDVTKMGGGNEPLFQNFREPSVFATGPSGENAYMVEGRVFVRKDGDSFTAGEESIVPITFPCIPPEAERIHEEDCPPEYRHVFETEGETDGTGPEDRSGSVVPGPTSTGRGTTETNESGNDGGRSSRGTVEGRALPELPGSAPVRRGTVEGRPLPQTPGPQTD